jgi:hypothetical protein
MTERRRTVNIFITEMRVMLSSFRWVSLAWRVDARRLNAVAFLGSAKEERINSPP